MTIESEQAAGFRAFVAGCLPPGWRLLNIGEVLIRGDRWLDFHIANGRMTPKRWARETLLGRAVELPIHIRKTDSKWCPPYI